MLQIIYTMFFRDKRLSNIAPRVHLCDRLNRETVVYILHTVNRVTVYLSWRMEVGKYIFMVYMYVYL